MHTTVPATTLDKFTTFGDLLRFLRRRAGITQMELATAVGYSDAQISRLEQNQRLPDLPTLEARFIPVLDLEDDPHVVACLLALAANVRREDAPGLGLCPYKGLSFFDEGDADLFVGREALTARLVDCVLALANQASPPLARFLAVVGASGSGKSSLVRAGLVPALRWNKASTDWDVRVLTPTARPLESLAVCLSAGGPENVSVSATAALIDDLARHPRSLHLFARRFMPNPASNLLVVVDQFEELFSLCRSEDERQAFIDNLLTAASETAGPTLVVITLRADFYASCSRYPLLCDALARSQIYIGAMNGSELRRAIEEPARRGRWEMESGLVDLLLHDVGREPGTLPLLSHALLETWQRRRGRLLTLSGYAASGGIRGAIAETAEAVFTDQLTPQQRRIARRIFLRLTELGDHPSGDSTSPSSVTSADTRRRATLDELITRPEDVPTTQAVVNALANARLIVTSEETVEVAHEALIREWPTLRGWLEENRDALRLHRHLTEAAQEWQAHAREADLLYRGARLAQAREWAQAKDDEINPLEREFLEASQGLADCELFEQETQRQRELEAAQKLAEAERCRAEEQAGAAVQLRRRSFYLAAAFTIALGFAVVAGLLWRQSQVTGRLAVGRELAAAAINNLEVDPERSVLLALAALDKTYTLEAEDALHQAVMASRVRKTISAHVPGKPIQLAFSPDSSRLATSGGDQQVKVWDLASGGVLFSFPGSAPAYTLDGTRLATVLPDGAVRLWNASTGDEISLPGPIDGGPTVSFSPDGSRLATVTTGNLPRIWDLSTGREVMSFPGHTDFVSIAVFSPDGTRLLTASDDGSARVWDAATGKELLRLVDHPGWVWTATYSPDGNLIATASQSQAALWDAATGHKLFTLAGHLNTIFALAFSPDGNRLATASLDRKIKLWDTATGKEVMTLSGHTGAVTSLAFQPDGARLISGSDDGTVRIWDVTSSGEQAAPLQSTGPVDLIAYSPDGTRLAGTQDGTVKIWNNTTGARLIDLPDALATTGSYSPISALAYSPDGRLLVAGDSEGVIHIWEAGNGARRGQWAAHTGPVNALAFTPDGRLASASDDYKIKLWTLPKSTYGAPDLSMSPQSTLDLSGAVKSVAISPDGAWLAAGIDNGLVRIYDLDSLGEFRARSGHTDTVTSLAFSPDSGRLATASLDGSARLWNTADDRQLVEISGHSDAVTSIAFSPDGRRLATASLDSTARLWDSATGQELLTFSGQSAGSNHLAFSPDGARLVIAGEVGLSVYLLHVADLAALASSRLTRSLTVEECQKYLHQVSAGCSRSPTPPAPTPWPPAPRGRICQVTSAGGLYDNYFNQLMYAGIQDAAGKFGWQEAVLESGSALDFEKDLQSFLGADCKLITALGARADAIQRFTAANPGQKLLITDFPTDQPADSLWTQVYATDQGAFLAGYLAAAVTRTGKVGVFGGIDIPQVTGFMDGFALGAEYYNKKNQTKVEVLGWDPYKHVGLFAGGFCCTTEGRKMARQLMDSGADVILSVAGQSVGWGAGAEVQAHGKAWLIGVDTDWTITSPDLANVILTSIEKRYDISVLEAAQSIQDETFTGGVHTGTLATGEVGLSPFHMPDSLVSSQVKADLEQIKADIIAGKLVTSP